MSEAPAIQLTPEWVARAMNGVIRARDSDRAFAGVSIDTRTVRAGELFVAIRGERFDGAAFAGEAAAKGAAGVVVPRGVVVDATTAVVIEVDDTVQALQALGQKVRRESNAKVVAITGSAGKTTTKEVTSEFLESRYAVVRNRGNLNNHIGLPLSLVELRSRPDVAVVELGMNHAGEIATLVRIAEPDVRVWTNVGEAHLGFFTSVDAIAEAKAEIFEGANSSTLLVANADDEHIRARQSRFAGRVVTFGIERRADVWADRVMEAGIQGIEAHVQTARGAFNLSTPLLGRASLANVLAATAIAIEFEIPLDVIAERASRLRPAPHRGDLVRLPSGVTLIDDSYNANPTATGKALDLLRHSAPEGRRVAVLGEMLELGEHATKLHERVGQQAAAVPLDLLLTVGGHAAEALGDAAVGAGMDRRHVLHFATSEEAALAAAHLIGAGDVVLVKGSRGIRTDRVIEHLRGVGREQA